MTNLDSIEGHARLLHKHFEVHCLMGLHADDKLIAHEVAKDVARNILELDANLDVQQ